MWRLFVIVLGALGSLLMYMLDRSGTIVVEPDWWSWTPLAVAAIIVLLGSGGGSIFDDIGDVFD